MDIQDLHEAFCQYQATIKNIAPITIRNYKTSLSLFYKLLPEIQSIQQVTEHDANQFFFIGCSKRNWKPITYITHLKNINVFFKWAVKNKYIETNPFQELDKPRLEKKLPRSMTKQQASYLLQTVVGMPWGSQFIRARNQAIFSTFLYCGLRKSELLKLKVHEVDLLNLTIHIWQGKGGKDRIVPMPYQLKVSMEKYLVERSRLNKYTDYFFVSLTFDKNMSDSALKRTVEAVKEASGIKFYLHMLRHTFATLMLEGGCDIYSLSKMMGHSDIKTTTIYLSASVEHMRGQIMKHPLNS